VNLKIIMKLIAVHHEVLLLSLLGALYICFQIPLIYTFAIKARNLSLMLLILQTVFVQCITTVFKIII